MMPVCKTQWTGKKLLYPGTDDIYFFDFEKSNNDNILVLYCDYFQLK